MEITIPDWLIYSILALAIAGFAYVQIRLLIILESIKVRQSKSLWKTIFQFINSDSFRYSMIVGYLANIIVKLGFMHTDIKRKISSPKCKCGKSSDNKSSVEDAIEEMMGGVIGGVNNPTKKVEDFFEKMMGGVIDGVKNSTKRVDNVYLNAESTIKVLQDVLNDKLNKSVKMESVE